jgi:hypothetical protein
MLALVRFILVLVLLLEPVQGLTVQRCLALPAPAAREGAMPGCSCCPLGAANAAACPRTPRPHAACNCDQAQRSTPAPPPEQLRSGPFQVTLAFSPAMLVALSFSPPPRVRPPVAAQPPRWGSAHSVHQLLCTWLI